MRVSLTTLAILLAAPAAAQAPGNSTPQAVPIVDTIPPPRDVDYPGTLTLAVDATDVARGIFRVHETVPVAGPGPMVLLAPKWLPGDHGPTGQIDKLAGLVVTAGGAPVAWKRDTVDVRAFHITVPAGAAALDVAFQYVSPTDEDQGRVVMTPAMLNIEWDTVSLYPAGYYVRRIPITASVTYPHGWKAATALRPDGPAAGDTIRYGQVAYDTLIDSPVFAGLYTRTERISPDVVLNLVADRPDQLAMTPDELARHRALVAQATKLFGAQHYDHYDFLLAVSDQLGGVGLEHHRSSEDGVRADYFTDWASSAGDRNLLPHEYTHSWNGKFRRPADLWTPDYRTPMQDDLLWVYEGMTQFWGDVLSSRSGLWSKDEALGELAAIAAEFATEPGRAWRPLQDTTNEEILSNRGSEPWRSWQRYVDYYDEGTLMWLDADSLIRAQSHGAKSLDDFAKLFFGVRDRDWGEITYTFDDIVAALNTVQPYDWAGFLRARLDQSGRPAPLDWIARGGYKLAYTAEPGAWFTAEDKARKQADLSYSLGLTVSEEGVVSNVIWDGPAFQAGVTSGATIVAANGSEFDPDDLKQAITAAAASKAPIRLLLKQGTRYRETSIAWTGGLRYPHLVRAGSGASTLDALLAAK